MKIPRRLKYLIYWVGVIVYLFVAMGFVSKKQMQTTCKAVDIQFVSDVKYQLVDSHILNALINNTGDKLKTCAFHDICIPAIEDTVRMFSPIKHADIYSTIAGKLVVEIEQIRPLIRIYDSINESYYIGANGEIFPHKNVKSPHILICNGLKYKIDVNKYQDISHVTTDSLKMVLDDLFKLSKYIQGNSLWCSQFEQVYINDDFDLELIPKVGNHTIILGDADHLQQKFKKLRVIYDEGFSRLGWNGYSKINLKFNKQVVLTQRKDNN